MPEPCFRSAPTVKPVLDPSCEDQRHVHEIDAPSWVGDTSANTEDNAPAWADGFASHSARLHSGNFLPDLGPEVKDGIVTVDYSCHTAWVRVDSGFKATSE